MDRFAFQNVQIRPLFDSKNEGCEIIVGDALNILKKFAPNTLRCCITSPPYWGLRDYGIPDQIGAETSVDDYVDNLTAIFREVRRVLTEDGTLWLNLGDSYTSGNRTWRDADKKNPARAMRYRPPTPVLTLAILNSEKSRTSKEAWGAMSCAPRAST